MKDLNMSLVRNLIKLMVDDLIYNTKNNIKNYKIKFTNEILNNKKKNCMFLVTI